MREIIEKYSNEYKVVIDLENLDFKATVKDV